MPFSALYTLYGKHTAVCELYKAGESTSNLILQYKYTQTQNHVYVLL